MPAKGGGGEAFIRPRLQRKRKPGQIKVDLDAEKLKKLVAPEPEPGAEPANASGSSQEGGGGGSREDGKESSKSPAKKQRKTINVKLRELKCPQVRVAHLPALGQGGGAREGGLDLESVAVGDGGCGTRNQHFLT